MDGEVGRDWGGGGWYCGVSGEGFEVWWDGVMGLGVGRDEKGGKRVVVMWVEDEGVEMGLLFCCVV